MGRLGLDVEYFPTSRQHWILVAALMLLPFIHLGINFYLSVQMLMFLLMASLLPARDGLRIFFYGGGLIVFVLMISSLLFQPLPSFTQSFFWVLRLFVCFIVLLTFLSRARTSIYFDKSFEKIISLIAFFLCGFSLMQQIAIKAGVLIYLPRSWYVLNAGTLGDELSLLFEGVRPSATFGEPSYLGFVALSLYVIVLIKFTDARTKLLTSIALWGAVLFCATFSGLLALIIITTIYQLKKGVDLTLILVATLILPLVFLTLGNALDILPEKITARISGITSGDVDESTNSRMLMPFSLVAHTFQNYPLGETIEVLTQEVGLDAVRGTDNGFLLIFVNFGISAFFIFGLIFLKVRHRPILAAYLLMASMFNGGVFTFDKVVVMSLVVLMVGNEIIVVENRSHAHTRSRKKWQPTRIKSKT